MITHKLTFPADKKVYYCGDIHGCYDLFMSKLNSIGFNEEEDVLICTGDLIDRGKQNEKCLELIDEPWFFSVVGNHEDMAFKTVFGGSEEERDYWASNWLYNGGSWYLDYYGTDDISYINELIKKTGLLPHVLEIKHGERTVVVCHADWPLPYYPNVSANIGELTEGIIWSRERYNRWDSQWDDFDVIEGADAFVFGHTPVSRPTSFGNQHYLDTGAVFTDNLTIKELNL